MIILLISVVRRQEVRVMVLCIPGQGSPEWATAKAAVGVTILFAAGCNPVASKMVGPRRPGGGRRKVIMLGEP